MQLILKRVAVAAVFATILGAGIAANAQTSTTPVLQSTPSPTPTASMNP
jgi:hypothetical protein